MLESLHSQQEKGKWFQSRFFTYVGAAFAWGQKPSSVGLCQPDEDVAVMAAYTRSVNEMAAWEEKKRKKPKKH